MQLQGLCDRDDVLLAGGTVRSAESGKILKATGSAGDAVTTHSHHTVIKALATKPATLRQRNLRMRRDKGSNAMDGRDGKFVALSLEFINQYQSKLEKLKLLIERYLL